MTTEEELAEEAAKIIGHLDEETKIKIVLLISDYWQLGFDKGAEVATEIMREELLEKIKEKR